MITQNIFIINFDLLYEILDEIKDNLSFNIVKLNNEQEFLKSIKSKSNNLLIIHKNNKKPVIDLNLNVENILQLDHLPLHIDKLIELINIQLIKLKFNQQSKIIIKKYKINLNSKFISKEQVNLKLTEKEIEVILYLNNSQKKVMF